MSRIYPSLHFSLHTQKSNPQESEQSRIFFQKRITGHFLTVPIACCELLSLHVKNRGVFMKMNCWEYKKCGREPGGVNVHDLKICPATIELRLDGIHGGTNGGRCCWIVAETFCQKELQGAFAQKYKNCSACDFYSRVQEEEFPDFQLSELILEKMHKQNIQILQVSI
ncbi:MAG: two-CW domain-containing protein [Nitrospirota bacterium]